MIKIFLIAPAMKIFILARYLLLYLNVISEWKKNKYRTIQEWTKVFLGAEGTVIWSKNVVKPKNNCT